MLLAFSIFDAAAEAYLPPMFMKTKGMAIRSFADAVNQEDSPFHQHADDYTLFLIGSFDEQSGLFIPVTPDSMGNALQYLVTSVAQLRAEVS